MRSDCQSLETVTLWRPVVRNSCFSITFAVTLTIVLVFGLLGMAGRMTAAQAQSPGTVASEARLSGDEGRTRFVAVLSRKVDITAFALADPYRVVIDMPDIEFQLPQSVGSSGLGLVQAFRYGLFAEGKSRIVIDVSGPVYIERAEVRPTAGKRSFDLVVDLVPTDRQTFFKLRAERQNRLLEKQLTMPNAIPKPSAVEVKPDRAHRIVVIDPGHGGVDSGALGRNSREKDIVLAVGKILREELQKRGRYKVLMTRDTDVFISLRGRVDFAREHRADLFVSVHADSADGRGGRRANGATIYTLAERASDDEARVLAAKENMSDVLAGVEDEEENDTVATILADLWQRESMVLSDTFAGGLITNMRRATNMRRSPHKSARFRVLKNPEVPSVLIELGYITNSEDESQLISDTWRRKVAKAIGDAIDGFFAQQVVVAPFGSTQ